MPARQVPAPSKDVIITANKNRTLWVTFLLVLVFWIGFDPHFYGSIAHFRPAAILPRVHAAFEIIITRPAARVAASQHIIHVYFNFATCFRIVLHFEVPPTPNGVGIDYVIDPNVVMSAHRYRAIRMRDHHRHRPVRGVENLSNTGKCTRTDVQLAIEHIFTVRIRLQPHFRPGVGLVWRRQMGLVREIHPEVVEAVRHIEIVAIARRQIIRVLNFVCERNLLPAIGKAGAGIWLSATQRMSQT